MRRRLDAWMDGRLLPAFNDWFTSAAGVRQTFLIVVAILALELAFPHLDVSGGTRGFWLLFALTVYSGVTQPALAYAQRRQGEQTDDLIKRLERTEEQNAELLRRLDELQTT